MKKLQIFDNIPFDQSTVSLDLTDNGASGEFMKNSTDQGLGIANAWTINYWIKRDRTPVVAGPETFIQLRNSGAPLDDAVNIQIPAGGSFNVALFDSAGAQFKDFNYGVVSTTGEWQSYTHTWDGTDLLTYINGIAATPTKNIDIAGTMADGDRQVELGTNRPQFDTIDGRYFSGALWSTALTSAEAFAVHNGGNGGSTQSRCQ